MSQVKVTARCTDEDLAELPRKILEDFVAKLSLLATDAEYGKPLTDELRGYRSLPLARYRILYRYLPNQNTVWVVMVGPRKEGSRDDVYERMIRLVRSGRATLE